MLLAIFAATISTQDSRFSQNFSTNLGVDEFEVSLTGRQDELRLRVHDSGTGFELNKTSNGHEVGLIVMKEAETSAQALTRALYSVEPITTGAELYFPERSLAQFLSRRGEDVRIYAFEQLGVAPIREAYAHLVQSLGLDAIVLVDGGTDVLLRGDEEGLGTPAEDMAKLKRGIKTS